MSQERMLASNFGSHPDRKTLGQPQGDSGTTVSDNERDSIPLQSIINDPTPEADILPPSDTANAPSGLPQSLKTSAAAVTPGPSAAAAAGERIARPKGSVQIREPPVSEKHGYRIVKMEQKHGLLHRAIPLMPLWLAILLCLLNILLPGTGTVISAFTVFCCGVTTRMTNPVHAMVLNLVSGLLQMATFLLIVGWIWSILWGMTFVQLALSAKEDTTALSGGALPYYVRRHSSVE